jgi:hypothetical protein
MNNLNVTRHERMYNETINLIKAGETIIKSDNVRAKDNNWR